MDDVRELFKEYDYDFTVYAVEKQFATGQGLEYFKSYRGKPNYIESNDDAQHRIKKIVAWIGKHIPNIGALLKLVFSETGTADIVDIVVALQKLFASQEHQAVGPEVIDPIILQEGSVYKKNIEKLIYLHKDNFLAPTIIIILQDNNIERAKTMFSNCPNGMNVKFVKNNGQHEIFKVINPGALSIKEFISAFSQQCFSTCSKTKHSVLINPEWEQNSIVRRFAPLLLKYRSNLICDEKREVINGVNDLIRNLETYQAPQGKERILTNNFLCIAKIFKVFCNDSGGTDIQDAIRLAQITENDILLAHVYKYAYFFPECKVDTQKYYLEKAYNIFKNNNMLDNALYCKNNMLVRQFDGNSINPLEFRDMLGEAMSSVPGLVGMSHIMNNTGLAYLMNGNPNLASDYLEQGLSFSSSPERIVQRLAIQCNQLIIKSYYEERVEFSDINKLFKQIMDGMYYKNELNFISARYAMNLLVIAIRQRKSWGKELLQTYPIFDMINKGMTENTIGTGQLIQQINYVSQSMPALGFQDIYQKPDVVTEVTGRRKDFICNSGLNPFYFFTWL